MFWQFSIVMKRFIQIVLGAVGLCGGCSKQATLTPDQFTKEVAAALRTSSHGFKVTIVRDLQLKIVSPEGPESTTFLDNAYSTCKKSPESKDAVIKEIVSANLDTILAKHAGIDRTRVVPIIKDRPWLEETRHALLSRGAKKVPQQVYDDFNKDLIILYAEDNPQSIRYLTPKDLEEAKIEQKDLRALACGNLKRVIPKIERHGSNGLYMVTAGGTYEASLLLLDSIWNSKQMEVVGDIVVAIPNRDFLLVSGTGHPEAIDRMKQIAKKSFEEGSYTLTPMLFVYRNGRFDDFRTSAQQATSSKADPSN